MLNKKAQKVRRKKVKDINKLTTKRLVTDSSVNNNLKVTLSEAIDNYNIGSNHSSQIMAASFIEKLLKVEFKAQYVRGLSLNDFLKVCKENNLLDEKLIDKINNTRALKNINTHQANADNMVSPLITYLLDGKTEASKEAYKALKLCKKLYKVLNK